MWPDRVSNPGPLALESYTLLTVLHSPARKKLNGFSGLAKTLHGLLKNLLSVKIHVGCSL